MARLQRRGSLFLASVHCHSHSSLGVLLPQTESRQVEVEGVLGRQKEVIRQTLTKRDASLR